MVGWWNFEKEENSHHMIAESDAYFFLTNRPTLKNIHYLLNKIKATDCKYITD